MINANTVVDELGRFADLDGRVSAAEESGDILVRLTQLGDQVDLRINRAGGRVIERRDGKERRHASYIGLLSSEGFGNLRRFADAQRALLTRDAPYLFSPELQLPVNGILELLESKSSTDLISDLDVWLTSQNTSARQRAVVLDGPAGVGKTHVIRSICHKRIVGFGPDSKPLLLHVQSRGRKLTTLNDVIAGTLNTLRLSLTFEQLPVLCRHGLIDVAIDGFDELADPNGYETAWASLRDFVEDIAGRGCLILAGRDTFIDADQVRKTLPRLDTPELSAAHLRSLHPTQAVRWLEGRDVSTAAISTIRDAGLLEPDSYSLRPFYVLQIAKAAESSDSLEHLLENPLDSLVEALVLREARILSDALQDPRLEQIGIALRAFLEEVSREMADGERDWIELSTLSLLSDLTFTGVVSADEVGMLRHRVHAIALLEPDIETGRRRFPHGEIQDYFLSASYLALVQSREIPKSLRRNIIGSELLETFHDVAMARGSHVVTEFATATEEMILKNRSEDRSRTNLSALLLAIPGELFTATPIPRIASVTLDEACVRGAAISISLLDVFIAQLDCRDANIGAIQFDRCSLGALLVTETTSLSASLPTPASLSLEKHGVTVTEYNINAISAWIRKHTPVVDKDGRSSQALELLEKLCRVMLRQNWIRAIDQDRAGRVLASPLWPDIRRELEGAGLLKVRSGVQVGGPRSEFLRIHRARELLESEVIDPQIASLRARISAIG